MVPAVQRRPVHLVTNGCQTGTTGTLNAPGGTGNTATSWTIYNNGGTTAYTAAKVARTDLPGHEWSQITATTGNVDSLKHQAGGITTGWAVGDTLLVTREYQTDTDLASVSEFRMDVNQVGGPGLASDLYKGGAEVAVTTNPGPAGVLQTEFVVATGTTQLQVQRIFKTTLGTVRWGRCSVYNLTALGLTR